MRIRTGLTLMNFQVLLDSLPALKNKLKSNQSASDALFMYLMKLRTALSDEAIGEYFGVSNVTVRSRLKLVRSVLLSDFVPLNVNHTRTRAELISHTSKISQCLLSPENENAVIHIWDGTYIYVEKSHQHEFQKKSYCSHKKRNYVKPMMIVATDGTIIAVIGPFQATDNDAKIANAILTESHPALQNLHTSDVVVLDRGFRDSIREFQSRGFIVKTPACQPVGKQLTVLEANRSRLVTRIRFDVERINGMIKSTFNIFSVVWESWNIPYLMNDLQIAAGILNKFFIKPKENKEASQNIARKMLSFVHTENALNKIIYGISFKSVISKKRYAELLVHSIFPSLSMNDLQQIAFGNYQIAQAKLYAWDHLKNNDGVFRAYTFEDEVIEKHFSNYIADDPALITINIGSRFISGKQWKPFVLFSRVSSGYDAILGYCCNCKVGLRTVGCCSHVMTILYFLGYAQYNGNLKQKAKHLENVLISKK